MNALGALGPGLAVLDDEARQHLGARVGLLDGVQADELGAEPPARDADAHVAALVAARRSFMCGTRRISASTIFCEGPCEVIDVPQNSLATTGDFASSKSGFRSATQCMCTSPPITTGLRTRVDCIASSRRRRAAG